ncbi:NAD(P)/FAD-dependent oxidoreductase [Roseateles violae]|uniref:FAD-binding oxidoreductase n=1 Tax=Roseateles violae TaxID=3058042 RepID=A0ABT8E074_9BURK|nr:FAD-binding oxidoreductase [Pelomonas sp. PFR6]MDN3923210.1 FAD-binding oxidoreductase [Pelomonas sp. PFR6]
MGQQVLVLGAGMVGTCTALELQLRGHDVVLLDRRGPGQETSYGNAGAIQREAVEPYPMPRDWRTLLSVALRQGLDVDYQLSGLLAAWPQLLRYWRESASLRHQRTAREYATLIAHSTAAHDRLIELAGARDLVRESGLRFLFRTAAALEAASRQAERLRAEHGLGVALLDGPALAAAEPALRPRLAGAVHWLDTWCVSDPGALVERYAALFRQKGGRLLKGDALSLRAAGPGWQVDTEEGRVSAAQAVLALGPWSGEALRRLGYRWPLFVKRGYHRHYAGGATLNVAALDAERGYVLAPQCRGLRLTSGAQIARIDAPPAPRQLHGAEREARQLLDLGQAVEAQPWMGSRPCSADMKPVIGALPQHPGLWVNCGHGHQGFTLGPVSGRLLAELMEGRPSCVPTTPFSPLRF